MRGLLSLSCTVSQPPVLQTSTVSAMVAFVHYTWMGRLALLKQMGKERVSDKSRAPLEPG